jgi:oligosaccharide repeat unit polymerase
LVVLTVLTGIGIIIGRIWFKRWFNPLSAYSAIWGFCLCNYELRLIQYYLISAEAWFYIGAAWLSLYLGTAFVHLLGAHAKQLATPPLTVPLDKLKKGILILSMIGAIGVIGQAISVLREFGSLSAAVLSASDLYNARTSNELSGLPYLGSFSYAACTLAGIHVAMSGRFAFITLAPIMLVAAQLVFLVGRTGLGIAAVLFLVAALHATHPPRKRAWSWRHVLGISVAILLLAGSFLLVSSVRGLGVDYPGVTPAMDRISEYVPVAPSIYSNFSATPVAFSMYLSSPHENKAGFWGMYTFGPIFRLLSRLGFPTRVAPYEEDYWTPFPVNTSTYLKNLHSDFGPIGIFIFPLIIGAAAAYLTRRTRIRPKLVDIVILSNIYVLVVFSFSYNFTVSGDWWIAACASTVAAIVIERKSRACQDVSATVAPSSAS